MKISTIRFEPDFKSGLMKKYDCYYEDRDYGPQSSGHGNFDETWVHLVVDDVYLVRCDYFEGRVEYDGIYTLKKIRKSVSGAGNYQIFNCSCLNPECGGWDEGGTIVHHSEEFIEWTLPEKEATYRFTIEQYKSALQDLDKNLEPILAYDSWKIKPEHSGDPLLWAISSNQNAIVKALLEGRDIEIQNRFEPEKYDSFETYSSYAREVGNTEAHELISQKLATYVGD